MNETVAIRTSFDGVRVTISADGKVSDPLYTWFGSIHKDLLWTVINNICTFTAEEVRKNIKAGGSWNKLAKPAKKKREHHHSCQCGSCGGQNLSPGWIPATPKYVR